MAEKKKKKWIRAAVAEGKGKLHEHLGVPKGEKIPEEKLREAANSKNSTIRKEANLAMTLKGLHKKKEEKKAPTMKGMLHKMYGKKSTEEK